jgi:hypothetical protein
MLERIARTAGVPELADMLAERISAADLVPMSLRRVRRRA